LWAEDVRSIIEALALGPTILIGWSYGGFIIGDYLRCFGEEAVAGVNFVAGAVGIGPGWFGRYIGPGFLDHAPPACSEDQAIALDAIQAFVHGAAKKPLAPELIERAIGWSMLVHPRVRANLIDRVEDFTPELAVLHKPTLITYGSSDTAVLPAMAERIAASVAHAESSEYAGVGHLPFVEESGRFNAELAAFAQRTFGLS
jgi:pimeloyl-ACP methyl ester carboxylesterase